MVSLDIELWTTEARNVGTVRTMAMGTGGAVGTVGT
jgi:hypothetical protein